MGGCEETAKKPTLMNLFIFKNIIDNVHSWYANTSSLQLYSLEFHGIYQLN